MATRWGICGAGKICMDFCRSLRHLPRSEHEIVAVAASNKERASNFAAEFDIAESYGSYDDLATSDNVDVIYIGVIHTLHVDMCLKYINAGKHVVCEKPMALSLEGCKRVLTAAKEKNVLFLEATWSRFFPVYEEIRTQISSGALGDVNMVQATFCAPIATMPRVSQLDLGGGGLMDIGLYTVQAANMVFKGQPEEVVVKAKMSDSGVDLTGTIILQYSGGRFASLNYSTETTFGHNGLAVRGTKGMVQIPDTFWCPTKLVMPDGQTKDFSFPECKDADKYNYGNGQGLMYEAQAVRKCLLNGLKETREMPHKDSEDIMEILQKCLDQLGIKYQHP